MGKILHWLATLGAAIRRLFKKESPVKLPKWVWIGLGGVLVAALLFGLMRIGSTGVAKASSDNTNGYQTAIVERGDLTASIAATGNVHANQRADLKWEVSAQVDSVHVAVGQKVRKDDVLVTLEASSLPQSLIQAQSDLISAQRNLQNLFDEAETKRAQAEQSLAQAQGELDDAQTRRDWLNNDTRADENTILKTEAEYYMALNRIDEAQSAVDNTWQLDEQAPARTQAVSALAEAKRSAEQTKWMLDYYRGHPDAQEIAEGEADLQVARARLEDARREYDRVKAGAPDEDVRLAQNKVDMAQAAVDKTRITAPFDGVVTRMDVKPGDLISTGQFALRVDDLSSLFADVEVSEVDINSVEAGQPVILTFDAVPDREYRGKVTEVGKAGTESAGVVNFPVTVRLDDADGLVKPGMTAAVTITVAKLENVLKVPSRAVRTVDNQRVIYLLDSKNALQPVVVELGASADATVEITKGQVKEGDVVVLNPPSVQSMPAGPGARMQGGM
jgi:HlyD family secretion protein